MYVLNNCVMYDVFYYVINIIIIKGFHMMTTSSLFISIKIIGIIGLIGLVIILYRSI
jgi:hypothetical protein